MDPTVPVNDADGEDYGWLSSYVALAESNYIEEPEAEWVGRTRVAALALNQIPVEVVARCLRDEYNATGSTDLGLVLIRAIDFIQDGRNA